MQKLLLILTLVCAAASAQTKSGPALTGNSDNGKRLFLKNGCYQCHGQSGQGGLAGARLAQIKLAQPAFIAYVRNPAPGGMPPYRAKVMSDQELADVFAYIKTLPEPPEASSIPILNQ
jgi:mono/diheme cytochrome c family protein